MSILCYISIKIYEENYPALDDLPEQEDKQQGNGQEGGVEIRGHYMPSQAEGIICPHKANRMYTCWRLPQKTVNHYVYSYSKILST